MTKSFFKLTYYRKQLLVVIGINFLSLAVATTILYHNLVEDYRDNLVKAMISKVSMLKVSSASALLFDDNLAAENILSSLTQSPNTRFAQIFDTQKRPFASYVKAGQKIDITPNELQLGSMFIEDRLYLYQPIELDGESLGYIVLSADTQELKDQQNRYARIILAVFFVSLLFAYALNWRLQSVMFAPIKKLAELVAYVARERQYQRRMDVTQDDEIGSLVSGVNSMLDTIEVHEKQLQDNSERLEGLVALRTEQLFQRANYDALTQLPNRHLLIDRLNHGIDNAERENSKMILMFLDLDRFKVINDSLGHAIGDQLLSQVAKKLTHLVRRADSVCRWGGDEFVILLEHIDMVEKAESLAKQIIKSLSEPMNVSGHLLHISTCIGIAKYPNDGVDSGSLLKNADMSMYRAKDRGPGEYAFFEPNMLDDSVHRLTMESQLRGAIERNEFHLVYQPQICINTGKMLGMEALIRWNNNDKIIPPNEFLSVLDDIGLMHDLSTWVLETACKQNALWLKQGLPICAVAINLPASFIVQPNCAQKIKDTLAAFSLPAKYLEVEITENTFVASTDLAIRTLEQLKRLNIGIAIDDFGTGYSCMSYLRDLPISKLKIDGSFIQHLGDKGANDGIVKAIITLGKSLNLLVVGECIEQASQQKALKIMGCDVVQGFLHSKPLPASKMTAYLKAI